MLGTGVAAAILDAAWLTRPAVAINAVLLFLLVALALVRALHDDASAMRPPERLALLGLFLANYAAGVVFFGWPTATAVMMAAYATVMVTSALLFLVVGGGWLILQIARMTWQAGTLGLTRLTGGIMLLGGLAWMVYLGGRHPTDFNELLAIVTLQAMAALTIASGGMMVAAIRMR